MDGAAVPVTIRAIGRPDFEAWQRLWSGYLNYYETSLPPAQKQGAFERLLDTRSKVHGLLAEIDARPVGLVHYIFHDHMWRAEGICYLQDLYTETSVRRRGVGRALIEAVYGAARAVGVPKVYWLTQDFNAAGRALYDKIGKRTPFIRYDGA
ncbi:MAG: N-acetyltransferase family protein [Paracoccaceae bacterium]